jgi:hypothetical protein
MQSLSDAQENTFDTFRLNRTPIKFNGIVAYETFDLGLSAKGLFDTVREQLEPACETSLRLWSFELLQVPRLCKASAVEAAESDMIFVAAKEQPELPSALSAWIDLWRSQIKSRPITLVGIVAQPRIGSDTPSQVLGRLEAIATLEKMGFFYKILRPHPRRISHKFLETGGDMRPVPIFGPSFPSSVPQAEIGNAVV